MINMYYLIKGFFPSHEAFEAWINLSEDLPQEQQDHLKKEMGKQLEPSRRNIRKLK